MDISRDGQLHLGRRRILDRDSAYQLPSGNHIASPVLRRQHPFNKGGRATPAGKKDVRTALHQ